MARCSNLFTSYFPCFGNQKLQIVDGTLSSIVGKGSIPISKNLILNFILHAPNLSCNLFSISNLLKIVIVLLNSHLIVVNSKIWIQGGQLVVPEK